FHGAWRLGPSMRYGLLERRCPSTAAALSSHAMRLLDFLPDNRIDPCLQVDSKDAALGALAHLLAGPEEGPPNAARIAAVLRDREALATTGVGSGVAIPHGRVEGLPAMRAALAIHPAGIDFAAVDGRPVSIFFALIVPARGMEVHLQALAHISRLLRSERVRQALSTAQDRAALREAVAQGERTG
ncbi:MAG: PTS sugar transporter subunit IIA, partial [Polyangiales bacterium]